MANIDIRRSDALIIVDPQNDFCPGGALAVAGGDEIMEPISDLAERFVSVGATVVVSQDWHPRDHKSFASNHAGAEPFSTIKMPYGEQTLWPDHCVQNTAGAEFHPKILGAVSKAAAIIRKGMNPEIDSYSVFMENNKLTTTGLGGFLRARRVRRCFVVGLARNYCVGYSAIDCIKNEGMDSVLIENLTRSIHDGTNEQMTENLLLAGSKSARFNMGDIL